MQQNALLVVTRLREDRASLPPTVTLPAGAITFASYQRPDGDLQYQDGDLLFQKYVVLYHDAARREVRWQNLALTPEPAPSPLAGYTPRADDRGPQHPPAALHARCPGTNRGAGGERVGRCSTPRSARSSLPTRH